MSERNKIIIAKFWNQHYKYAGTTAGIPKRKVFDFFQETHKENIIYQEFVITSTTIGVKGKKARKGKLFLAEAISEQAKNSYCRNLIQSNTLEPDEYIIVDEYYAENERKEDTKYVTSPNKFIKKTRISIGRKHIKVFNCKTYFHKAILA